MSVKIQIPFILRGYTDNLEIVSLEGSTVGNCLADLVRKYPDIGAAIYNSDGTRSDLSPVCNVKDFHRMLGANEKVEEGDILSILSPGG